MRDVDDRERMLWLGIRQAVLIFLGAVETYLGIDRTVVPRRKRDDDRG